VSLHSIYEQYNQQVKFIKVYIREAHPVDGWWFGKGLMNLLLRLSGSKVSWSIYDPKTIQERREVAKDCEKTLQYGVKTYVDEMDDQVNKAYAAWPTRLYLIDQQGIVSYSGGLGPFGFKPTELKRSIVNLLSKDVLA
jgi:hypothetical protein